MDYKSTLNLPETDFPMKANLSQNELKIMRFWQEQDIYAKIRARYRAKEKYTLHDGPPYANGSIHIGHALNKILKDIIVRFKTMQGYDSVYVPGWDCHGLPVEHQLFKNLNIAKDQISQADFRKKAYDYALNFVDIQKQEFKRLGVFGEWDKPYLTLDKEYEYEIVTALGELVKRGFIYRGLKPVNWCAACETALAEAEVDYEEKTSPSIYVRFKVGLPVNLPKLKDELKSEFHLLIWTTTPWTLYANTAVALHPRAAYALARTEKGNLVVAEDLLPIVASDIGLDRNKIKVLKILKGSELEGLVYEHPFLKDGLVRKVVLADYVSSEEGTGLVHTAPGHGQDDYSTGLKNNLPVLMAVDKKGRFDDTVSDFKGQNVFSANKGIVEKLENSNHLLFFGQKQHSYPHCWRCKNPVIFRATKQWFLKIDHLNLKDNILDAARKEIVFIPESGRERIKAMIELRPDWCLSRQRYWGVPIPALRCADCSEEILNEELITNFSKKVLDSGSDCWFNNDIKDFIPPNLRCHNCKGGNFLRGDDILDVWFDSGVSYRAVLKRDERLEFPASLYLEGSDQHRGWFQASLIPSMAIEKKPPFKAALTHGFVVDAEGRKMSKSLGNVISPEDIIKEYGADILRLWVASSNYSEDIRISGDILSRLSDAYRKIRNTIRFMLSNLSDFSPSKDIAPYGRMLEIDRYIISRSYSLSEKVVRYYDNFEFYKVYQEVYQFCIVELSNFYLDVLKDRLYTFEKGGLPRRSAQSALWQITIILVKAIAPIIPFSAEEIWQFLKDKDAQSVHLSRFQLNSKYIDAQLENKWYNLIQFRAYVLKAIEEKRAKAQIGSSLEAELNIGIDADSRFLKDFREILAEVFIVSKVSLEPSNEPYIKVTKAEGLKCARCWNYSELTGSNKEHPQICPKCIAAISASKG